MATGLTTGQPPASAGPYDYGNYPSYLNPFGEGYGADCGTTNDTLPAIEISGGAPCYASLSSESNAQPCQDFFGCDVFTAQAELDDAVVVRFGSYCRSNFWYSQAPSLNWYTYHSEGNKGYGFFTVTEPGAQKIVVNMGTEYDSQGYHVCGGGRYGGSMKSPYTIYADVIPNTRPVVSVVNAPTRVLVGEPAEFQLSSTDADSDARGFTARATTTNTQASVASTTSGAVAVRVHEAQDVELRAYDQWNVQSDPVYRHVDVYEDDCGTGADIASLPLALGATCTAYLARSLGDDSDTFTVSVPSTVSRLAFSTSTSPLLQAQFRATAPDGTVRTVSDGSAVAAQPGTWTLEAIRQPTWGTDTSAGAYTVSVAGLSGPAPPVVSATAGPTSVVAGQWTSVSASASDLNGRNIRLDIDWGDGTTESSPWMASGSGKVFSHAYSRTGTFPVTVKGTNLDNLTATQNLTMSVALGADSCPSGSTALSDAPDSSASWSTAQSSAYSRIAPASCSGWISVFKANGSVDVNDVVRFRASALTGSALDLTARAGPTDQLLWRVSAVGRDATVVVFNDKWHRIGPGGTDTIRAPLALDVEYVYVEFTGAPSSSSWSVTATPSSL